MPLYILIFSGTYGIINCMEKKIMKKDNATMKDDLLPEYDLKKLRVRKVGPDRKYFAGRLVA